MTWIRIETETKKGDGKEKLLLTASTFRFLRGFMARIFFCSHTLEQLYQILICISPHFMEPDDGGRKRKVKDYTFFLLL